MMEPRAIGFLASHPPFAGVEGRTRQLIASRCRSTSRRAGEPLFLEGDPCRELFILVDGRVKCIRANAEGREQILRVFDQPGDVFCVTSGFSTGSYIVTAQAMTDVLFYAVDVETMKRAAHDQPALALALVTPAGEQMQTLVTLADDLSLKNATARVAKLLWERARRQGDDKTVRLSRATLREEEIAALVGAVRVHVSRSLKTLAAMGVITLDRESIRIKDVNALEAFVHAVGPERSRVAVAHEAR
jgi:CRP/FNR family transcriptional regulator